MSENLNKFFESKVSWLISLIVVVLAGAGAWYSQSTAIAVLEERYTQLENRVKESEAVAKQYQVLAQSIDSRLSRIEGALAASK